MNRWSKVPAGDYRLVSGGAGDSGPAQVFTDAGKTYLAAVLRRVPAGGAQGFMENAH